METKEIVGLVLKKLPDPVNVDLPAFEVRIVCLSKCGCNTFLDLRTRIMIIVYFEINPQPLDMIDFMNVYDPRSFLLLKQY